MHVTPEKMYSYDFVLGNYSLGDAKSDYQIERVKDGKEKLLKWVENKENILIGEKYQEDDW